MSKLTEALNWRYATKNFDPDKKVTPADITELCDAMRLSASSFGLQFWRFVVIQQAELQKQLRAHSWNQGQIEDCSHLIVLCTPRSVGDAQVDHYLESICQTRSVSRESVEGFGQMMKDTVNKMDQQAQWVWMDKQIYLVLGNLLTGCAIKHIDACPIEGFSAPDYDRILKLEQKGLRSVVVCAVGYRLSSDKYAHLSKVRYPLDEVVIKY